MSRSLFLRALVVVLTLLLAGCGKEVELYRQLSEVDANEVLAELASKHIEAEKVIAKDGVTIMIDSDSMARAVDILEAAGLPRKRRDNMGDIFKKDGVISSPLEERARYIYALSQELESTLSQIDGVVVARVHVVLPERVAPGEAVQPASAAVFIKYLPSQLDPDVILPRVQRMVTSSIPGLADTKDEKDKLAVVFVPAEAYKDPQTLVHFGPFLVPAQSVSMWQWITVGGILFILVLIGLIFVSLNSSMRARFFGNKNAVPADVSASVAPQIPPGKPKL
ncbi:type III secretion system inner membrane ring lipoprotein SctJ [Pokkaliibacter sp. CJK22405]|uniref:type III secretion system inner membrane ring lipoprotein SctJ n=1 Tax=Pokkaliibacter sp. CJK22405 TaxID=3384615 RepID=UPI003984B2A5